MTFVVVTAILVLSLIALYLIIQRDRRCHILGNDVFATWAQYGSYFNWNGHAVFYRMIQNSKVTMQQHLLMVHGYPTSSHDFQQILQSMNESDLFSKILLYDQLGHGFSDKPSHKHFTYSVMKSVDLLIDLIKYTAIDKGPIHILAHDLGDTLIQELMSRISERNPCTKSICISSICLLNGGIIPTVHRPLLTQRLALNPWTRPLVVALFNRFSFKKAIARTWGNRIALTDDIINAMWLVMTHKHGIAPLVHIQQYINERNLFCKRWIDALVDSSHNEEMQIPMLLINGVLDPISGKHMADAFEELVPDAKVVRLRDVGHWPTLEAPVDVCSQFLKFVESNS